MESHTDPPWPYLRRTRPGRRPQRLGFRRPPWESHLPLYPSQSRREFCRCSKLERNTSLSMEQNASSVKQRSYCTKTTHLRPTCTARKVHTKTVKGKFYQCPATEIKRSRENYKKNGFFYVAAILVFC